MTIREAHFPNDLVVVRELFEEYAAGLGIDLCFQGFREELAGLPGMYSRPAGGVWLAEVDGIAAGCIALRPRGEDRAELKRLYVRPAFRGTGIARALAERALTAAIAIGYRQACLDTLRTMTGAIALYRSLGFAEIEPYYHNPIPEVVYLGRELHGTAAGL
ncbi:MAG: GNAT family N-acetyltransferase [Gemmataceae bacterium]|nr:GNAT family N-acetyltransferase [Gemmataceae bacterium]